jgi:hypothetical protein
LIERGKFLGCDVYVTTTETQHAFYADVFKGRFTEEF